MEDYKVMYVKLPKENYEAAIRYLVNIADKSNYVIDADEASLDDMVFYCKQVIGGKLFVDNTPYIAFYRLEGTFMVVGGNSEGPINMEPGDLLFDFIEDLKPILEFIQSVKVIPLKVDSSQIYLDQSDTIMIGEKEFNSKTLKELLDTWTNYKRISGSLGVLVSFSPKSIGINGIGDMKSSVIEKLRNLIQINIDAELKEAYENYAIQETDESESTGLTVID